MSVLPTPACPLPDPAPPIAVLGDPFATFGEPFAAFGALCAEAARIQALGGWAMVPLALIALVMFGMGVHVHLRLKAKGFLTVPERTWRRWIDHPRECTGAIGRLVARAAAGTTIEETAARCDELRRTEFASFERDLRIVKVCVSAAPLVGLLGTVTGMLATFHALATGAGGDETMGMIASGISEALITTEAGLVVALPGLYFQARLVRRFERYKAFLTHLEAVCMQAIHLRIAARGRPDIHRAARERITRVLQQAAS